MTYDIFPKILGGPIDPNIPPIAWSPPKTPNLTLKRGNLPQGFFV